MGGKQLLREAFKSTPGTPAPTPVAEPEPYIDHEKTGLEHDALHCHFCSVHRKILQAAATQVAILQAILKELKESEGIPIGDLFNFNVATPVTSTVYSSQPTPYPGVMRSCVISGNGNVTLSLVLPKSPVGTPQTIAILNLSGQAHIGNIDHHIRVPAGSVFTMSTDAATPTLLNISAWLEPVSMGGTDQYRMQR